MPKFPYWKVPKIWPGEDVFILGGGPSLLDNDLSLIHNRKVIGVNDAYRLGTWVDVCWFGDWEWFRMHRKELAKFPGLIATHQQQCKHMKSVKVLQFREEGICDDPLYVARNRNSGGSAVNLAYHLGAKRIILLGFDMHLETGTKRSNWHDDNRCSPTEHSYGVMLNCFKKIAEDAVQLGLTIINATPESSLTLFPFQTLKEVTSDD